MCSSPVKIARVGCCQKNRLCYLYIYQYFHPFRVEILINADKNKVNAVAVTFYVGIVAFSTGKNYNVSV